MDKICPSDVDKFFSDALALASASMSERKTSTSDRQNLSVRHGQTFVRPHTIFLQKLLFDNFF